MDYIATNRDTLDPVVAATWLGVKQAKADPEKVAQLLVSYYKIQGLNFDEAHEAKGL